MSKSVWITVLVGQKSGKMGKSLHKLGAERSSSGAEDGADAY